MFKAGFFSKVVQILAGHRSQASPVAQRSASPGAMSGRHDQI